MIHDKKEAIRIAHETADANEAPVWIEWDWLCKAYIIHENPPPDFYKSPLIIPPKEGD